MSRQKEIAKTIEELNKIIELSADRLSRDQMNTLMLTQINLSLMTLSETLAIICDKLKEGE